MFHPHPHDLMDIPLDRWMLVHYGQLALFPLAAWSVILLVRGMSGFAPRLCRTAMFVFGISYVAFDTAAGIVTDVLVRAAHATASPDAWRGSVLAVWNDPIVGGSSDGTPALAVIGTVAKLILLARADAYRNAPTHFRSATSGNNDVHRRLTGNYQRSATRCRSHFARDFKRRFGAAPTRYARRLR
jgi:hypothetical protein